MGIKTKLSLLAEGSLALSVVLIVLAIRYLQEPFNPSITFGYTLGCAGILCLIISLISTAKLIRYTMANKTKNNGKSTIDPVKPLKKGVLEEIKNIKKYENEPFRKWFWSERLDLTVWYNNDDAIVGFQLCYGKGVEDKALTWDKDKGFTHDTVDEGDNPGGYKRTAILEPDGVFDKDKIINIYKEESVDIEEETAQFVMEKLNSYEESS